MLTLHVGTSVGLLGAVGAFLALALVGLDEAGTGLGAGIYGAMDLIARTIIVPLAFAAIGIGLLESLGTAWGLLRNYWVVFKLLITILATIVLLMQLDLIAALAGARGVGSGEGRLSLVLHAGGGLLVLLLPLVLSIYKPRGRTPLGQAVD